MITVRTRRKIGMSQQILTGRQEESFVLGLGQNLLEFINKYSEEDDDYESSRLYATVDQLVKDKDVEGLKKVLSSIQIFGTYDKVSQLTTKYKNISTACGLTYNGTIYEGTSDEKTELERIITHTCTLCSSEGDEFMDKILA